MGKENLSLHVADTRRLPDGQEVYVGEQKKRPYLFQKNDENFWTFNPDHRLFRKLVKDNTSPMYLAAAHVILKRMRGAESITEFLPNINQRHKYVHFDQDENLSRGIHYAYQYQKQFLDLGSNLKDINTRKYDIPPTITSLDRGSGLMGEAVFYLLAKSAQLPIELGTMREDHKHAGDIKIEAEGETVYYDLTTNKDSMEKKVKNIKSTPILIPFSTEDSVKNFEGFNELLSDLRFPSDAITPKHIVQGDIGPILDSEIIPHEDAKKYLVSIIDTTRDVYRFLRERDSNALSKDKAVAHSERLDILERYLN